MASQRKRSSRSQERSLRTRKGTGSPSGTAAASPASMREGAMAAVGSMRTQPLFASQTSAQAWASDWRTVK